MISLLCCCYKLLERLLLTRLAPIFESVIPPEQAGFRKKRNTSDQVLALTSYIESGFQKKLKTGAVLMVWYGMIYLFFHRQYKVISKQIASEMLPYTVNERRPPYNPKVVLPQLLYR